LTLKDDKLSLNGTEDYTFMTEQIYSKTLYNLLNYYRYEQDSGNRQAGAHLSKMLISRFTSLHATFYRIPCKIAFSGFYAENVR